MILTKAILAAALGAALFMGAPAQADGTLTVAQRQDPANWDPIDTFLVAWSSAGGNIFDGLIRRDENLKLQPGLAEAGRCWRVECAFGSICATG